MRILDLYCALDAFWQRFEPRWVRELLTSGLGSYELSNTTLQIVNAGSSVAHYLVFVV